MLLLLYCSTDITFSPCDYCLSICFLVNDPYCHSFVHPIVYHFITLSKETAVGLISVRAVKMCIVCVFRCVSRLCITTQPASILLYFFCILYIFIMTFFFMINRLRNICPFMPCRTTRCCTTTIASFRCSTSSDTVIMSQCCSTCLATQSTRFGRCAGSICIIV